MVTIEALNLYNVKILPGGTKSYCLKNMFDAFA